jgi:hypothetical protein
VGPPYCSLSISTDPSIFSKGFFLVINGC